MLLMKDPTLIKQTDDVSEQFIFMFSVYRSLLCKRTEFSFSKMLPGDHTKYTYLSWRIAISIDR